MTATSDFIARHRNLVLVEVTEALGSTPREVGAHMLVASDKVLGTVGGGNLEFAATEMARAMLAEGRLRDDLAFTLGPHTGQCCGGRVVLRLTRVDNEVARALMDRMARDTDDYPDVYLFGAGHVGHALAMALVPLPMRVTVVETRAEELETLAAGTGRRVEAMPEAAVRDIRPGGAAVILTHDHALDFLIGAASLIRDDLAYVGMIGSRTKRAVFAGWLDDAGHDRCLVDRLVLPIGGGAVRDKRPAVIAALVAAELLTALSGR